MPSAGFNQLQTLFRRLSQSFRNLLPTQPDMLSAKVLESIRQSSFISRDLSWLQFNFRVLAQSQKTESPLLNRLKFLAITASNLDEFFMIRVGSLYNYLDYGKERVDYSGLREQPFRHVLFEEAHRFVNLQNEVYDQHLRPGFRQSGFDIIGISDLTEYEQEKVLAYFKKTIYPMLTPQLVDIYHTFPILNNKTLVFGVVTEAPDDSKNPQRLSFVQIPQNLPRFYEIDRSNLTLFLPLEEIIRWQIDKLFRNVTITSANLFRITRNGDISIEEVDDVEADFAEEVRRKLNSRRTGRVVRIEIEDGYSSFLMKILKSRWEIDLENIFVMPRMIDYTGLWQIINHPDFKEQLPAPLPSVPPLTEPKGGFDRDIFGVLKQKDVLLHHPYNNMEPVLQLLEQAAEDPAVLSIKLTIYRLSKDSRIINALLRAAENGKYVSALFEVKARFDEEHNINQARRLQKAGCFVIYGVSSYKTHTKLLLIVRKEEDKVTRYVHLSSGNYNESTARLYSDVSLMTTNETYANDVSEFFNVITGHSIPDDYQYLITAPRDMRRRLIEHIDQEAENAKKGLPSGIVIKINSLEDKATIEALYKASQAGVKIDLIVRGICCLRPGRKGLSENITVRSIVGEYLEHARLYYFHNHGQGKIFGGSADMMNRSYDRRIESLFQIVDEHARQEAINILAYNLKDNVNSWLMQEDGSYQPVHPAAGEAAFNIHKSFFTVSEEDTRSARLF